MKRYWPFLLFAAAVVVHHGYLLMGDGQLWTKGLLMSTLLVAVLLVAFWTDRGIVAGRRSSWAFSLLCAAIVFSGVGDVTIVDSFVLAVAMFAIAQLSYIVLFAVLARSRSFPWWSIPYALVYSPIIAVLWGHLGSLGALIAVYGLLLLGMAVTSVVVSPVVAFGGLAFLVSEAVLVLRIFVPEWLEWFPDPYQDVVISLLYCVGQGLIAYGMIRRLEREPEFAVARARRRSEVTATAYVPTLSN